MSEVPCVFQPLTMTKKNNISEDSVCSLRTLCEGLSIFWIGQGHAYESRSREEREEDAMGAKGFFILPVIASDSEAIQLVLFWIPFVQAPLRDANGMTVADSYAGRCWTACNKTLRTFLSPSTLAVILLKRSFTRFTSITPSGLRTPLPDKAPYIS